MTTVEVSPIATPKSKKKKKASGIKSPDTYEQQQLGEFPRGGLSTELFPHELKALNEVKNLLTDSILSVIHDRLLMGMLFARKFDLERTVKMAKGFYEWVQNDERVSRAYKPNTISKEVTLCGAFLSVPGARTIEGYALLYNRVTFLNPATVDREDALDFATAVHLLSFTSEGMDYHRNGICVVVDMKGMTWAHFDVEMRKKLMELLENKFPCRTKRLLVLNPPVFLTALMAIARLFVKSKILSRMRILSSEADLLKYIDKSQLHEYYGGDVSYTPQQWLDHILEAKKRLFQQSKKGSKKATKK
mmetsp:Transcript_14408/g.15974  ORF Transcript_14408/g.15974 Transcript_14408/m.15974 type:complete len:304 (-) Transcript_14408:528-1439(-)